MERSQEIEARTQAFYDALKRRDATAATDLFSTSEGVTLIGTDPSEWWTDHATIAKIWEAQLGELGSLDVEGANPKGYARGDIGWVADSPTLVLEGQMRIPLRITGVYTREDGTWKLAQWHASIGVANEESLGEGITTRIDDTA